MAGRTKYFSKAYVTAKKLPLTQDADNQGIGTDQDENSAEHELRSSLAAILRPHCLNGALLASINGADLEFATVAGAAGISGGGYRVPSLDPLTFTGGDASDTWYVFYDEDADAVAKQTDATGYPAAPDIFLCQVDWDGATTLSSLVDLRRTVPGDGTRVIEARITHDGGASQTIGTMPARSMLEGCRVLCEESIAGASGFSADLGDASDDDGIMEYAQLGTTLGDLSGDVPSDLGIYLSTGNAFTHKYYATPTAISATIAGSATAGEWSVFLIVRELPWV